MSVEHLIDTVHFTHSHHSRMLQLADLYVYLKQLVAAGDHGRPARRDLINYVARAENMGPVRYKEWPPEISEN